MGKRPGLSPRLTAPPRSPQSRLARWLMAQTAVFGQAAQEGVGLHGVLGVEEHGGVGANLGFRVIAESWPVGSAY